MNTERRQPLKILLAEDDEEDQMFVKEAFAEAKLADTLFCVNDGEELMDYLHKRGQHKDANTPALLLLDLNMPKKDGREVVKEIRQDSRLCSIPIIILTTSSAQGDILQSYELGVNTYIRKPVTFKKMVTIIDTIRRYWFEIAELPYTHYQHH